MDPDITSCAQLGHKAQACCGLSWTHQPQLSTEEPLLGLDFQRVNWQRPQRASWPDSLAAKPTPQSILCTNSMIWGSKEKRSDREKLPTGSLQCGSPHIYRQISNKEPHNQVYEITVMIGEKDWAQGSNLRKSTNRENKRLKKWLSQTHTPTIFWGKNGYHP